ncbi:: hypothetical protein [Arcticibacter svalbardensis MN12-7]|uniref:Uncharacterized protein n=1 Tax=Arcticibacter svalbardensis MN12-7 TaxID=1150600 RepID=R9GW68_9SPHI|nr:hypothetical protein [Arcticibacter svalbardensis]EOR96006.1 : hypothetical protein [Arcticibacter svalbardensis MN12-7]
MKRLILFFILGTSICQAQELQRFNPDTVLTIRLDSAVSIKGERINVQMFINKVTSDTSFYEAFRKMKQYSFTAENRIFTFDKKNRVEGKIYRKIFHNNQGKYKMQYLAKQDSGKLFKKNGKYQLYTVEMFDYIFMNAYNSDFVKTDATASGDKKGNESYKDKLKTLLFTPGRPVKGVPLIGSKTQIFSPNMRQYYDYTFYSGNYLDTIPIYTFRVKVKDDLSGWTKSGLMIKELNTIFDKRNMQILGRSVTMNYGNLVFDFDVKMNIEMGYFDQGETILPTKITYEGNWDVPFKKEERASFLILHKGYKKEH